MLYFLLISIITFVSTFMVVDTAQHLWPRLDRRGVAVACLGLWTVAAFSTLLGADWLTTLGAAHSAVFSACWWLLGGNADGAAVEDVAARKDYVYYPVRVCVPAFVGLQVLQWLVA